MTSDFNWGAGETPLLVSLYFFGKMGVGGSAVPVKCGLSVKNTSGHQSCCKLGTFKDIRAQNRLTFRFLLNFDCS